MFRKPKVLIGSDHAGFLLKQEIIAHFQDQIELIDLGTHSTESCDYPDIAQTMALKIQKKPNRLLGILICGTGIGVAIAANRFKGVRAAVCRSEFEAEMARRHNHSNILCLGERVTGKGLAFNIVKTFLQTPVEKGRHSRRVKKIDQGFKKCS